MSNFNPNFDREKFAFLELANRGEGLSPINYMYAKDKKNISKRVSPGESCKQPF